MEGSSPCKVKDKYLCKLCALGVSKPEAASQPATQLDNAAPSMCVLVTGVDATLPTVYDMTSKHPKTTNSLILHYIVQW